jgi:hypothetical protein
MGGASQRRPRARPPPELISVPDSSTHQQITREWWEKKGNAFQLYISQLVVDEAGAGDPVAASARVSVIRNLPLLDITPEVSALARAFLGSGRFPRNAATDAAHIAIAAVHGMVFLITWNCVHIADAAITRALALTCLDQGFECPVICTPEELLGE